MRGARLKRKTRNVIAGVGGKRFDDFIKSHSRSSVVAISVSLVIVAFVVPFGDPATYGNISLILVAGAPVP
jgi:hypothetical protein